MKLYMTISLKKKQCEAVVAGVWRREPRSGVGEPHGRGAVPGADAGRPLPGDGLEGLVAQDVGGARAGLHGQRRQTGADHGRPRGPRDGRRDGARRQRTGAVRHDAGRRRQAPGRRVGIARRPAHRLGRAARQRDPLDEVAHGRHPLSPSHHRFFPARLRLKTHFRYSPLITSLK